MAPPAVAGVGEDGVPAADAEPALKAIPEPEAGRGTLRQILSNAGILLGGKALNGVLSLGATALAARALGVDAFGVLVLVHAYVQTIG